MRIAAILLAAGGGTRFRAGTAEAGTAGAATHKLLSDLDGSTVFARSLANVLDSAVGPVVVVTGAAPLELPPGVIAVANDRWADGQAGSLALATHEAARLDAEFIVVGLADQPSIPPAAWRAVAGAPAEWQVVVASYDGHRGPHPVRLHRSVWAMLPQTGDDGARTLMREHPALVHEVPCPGSPTDIDTLEDLQRWTSS